MEDAALTEGAGMMAASRPATEGGTEDACGIASGFVAATALVAALAVRATGAAATGLVAATGAACASATASGCLASATLKRLESVADTSATLRGRPSLSKKIERLA